MAIQELTGRQFGRLTVLGLTGERRAGHRLWRARCECGGETLVTGSHLSRGRTRSCGCLFRETARANGQKGLQSNTYRVRGDAVEIVLTQGQIALIDAADLPKVMDGRGKWVAIWSPGTKSYYAIRHLALSGGKRQWQSMARVIMDAPEGMEVDHAKHRTLDNRRRHLRLATHAENSCNRRSRAPSGYAGVSWHKTHRKWVSYLNIEGRRRFLGYFDNPVEAAIMRDVFARLYHGGFANLNFPLTPEAQDVAA